MGWDGMDEKGMKEKKRRDCDRFELEKKGLYVYIIVWNA